MPRRARPSTAASSTLGSKRSVGDRVELERHGALVGQRAQRRGQPGLREHGRVDAVGEVRAGRRALPATSSAGPGRARRPCVSSRARSAAAERASRSRKDKRQQALLRPVVQVALQPPARLVAGHARSGAATRATSRARASSSAASRSLSRASRAAGPRTRVESIDGQDDRVVHEDGDRPVPAPERCRRPPRAGRRCDGAPVGVHLPLVVADGVPDVQLASHR